MKMDLAAECSGISYAGCMACGDHPLTLHCDADMKLRQGENMGPGGGSILGHKLFTEASLGTNVVGCTDKVKGVQVRHS